MAQISSQISLSDEHVAILQLIRSKNIGPISFFDLFDRFGSARKALIALPDLILSSGRSRPVICPMHIIEKEVLAVRKAGAQYCFFDDADYPLWLQHIDSKPPVLIMKGVRALAHKPAVAIVGARNASAASRRFASDIAAQLAQAGFLVVSGLARGIDTAAHQGVMQASKSEALTAGVIASGIDIAYPHENTALQADMAERALVIAEHPPGSEPVARNFPYRNRIIAGMAIGTLVVEAAPRSGSLITARLANEAGREVMAVPGSPLDSRSRGCNELIREGATLVQNVEDIIELLSPIGATPQMGRREPVMRTSDARQRVGRDQAPNLSLDLEQPQQTPKPAAPSNAVTTEMPEFTDLLSTAPVSIDELIRQSGQSAGDIQSMLLDLELLGRLERHSGGRVSLK